MSIISKQRANSTQQNLDAKKPLCAHKCQKRTCHNINCREAWARKQTAWLWYAHRLENFTHHLRLTPPRGIWGKEKVVWVKDKIGQLRQAAEAHPGKIQGVRFFPHDGKVGLHWHAAVRAGRGGDSLIRSVVGTVGRRGNPVYCLKRLTDWKYQLAYIAGWAGEGYSERIVVAGERYLVWDMGQPLLMSIGDMQFIWDVSRLAYCRSVFWEGKLPARFNRQSESPGRQCQR